MTITDLYINVIYYLMAMLANRDHLREDKIFHKDFDQCISITGESVYSDHDAVILRAMKQQTNINQATAENVEQRVQGNPYKGPIMMHFWAP